MRKIAAEFGVGLSSVSRIIKEKGSQKVPGQAGRRMGRAERWRRIEALEQRLKVLEAKIKRL